MVAASPRSGCDQIRRCPGWDDASPGAYFVTVCTQNHRDYFGAVRAGKMIHNQLGEITEMCWKDIPSHHEHVLLDAFVIMPNHVHGIIMIEDYAELDDRCVGTLHTTSLRLTSERRSEYFSSISPKKGSLAVVVRSYKSAVTKSIRAELNPSFAWQARYDDHIMRGERDLNNLRLYITLNPENWRTTEPYATGEVHAYA